MRKVSADWKTAILVCAKCSKRAGGGYGHKGKSSLADLLRTGGNGRKGRKADFGIVEMKCQKICPKHGVLAINTSRPRDWLIVPPGASVEEALDELGLSTTNSLDGAFRKGIEVAPQPSRRPARKA